MYYPINRFDLKIQQIDKIKAEIKILSLSRANENNSIRDKLAKENKIYKKIYEDLNQYKELIDKNPKELNYIDFNFSSDEQNMKFEPMYLNIIKF